MTNEWRTAVLKDLTVNYDGKRKPIKESDRRPGPYPYYGASGIVDYVEGYLFDGDYLLIAEDGENLRTLKTPIAFMAHGKFWVNNHAHIVTSNEKADIRFLMYVIQGMDISGYLTGAVMPKLTQGNLNKIELDCPRLCEQRAIAHILGILDDKIRLNRQMNETLEAMAMALFKSWFVDFDPVRAKMDGRWKRGESLPGLPADLFDIFPAEFQNAGLGVLPKGWTVGSLESLAVLSTKSISPNRCPESVFEHYSIPAFDLGLMPVMENGRAIKSNKYIVFRNAILVSKLNPQTPRIWLPLCMTDHSVCSTEFMQFVSHQSEHRSYLYCLMKSKVFQDEMLRHVTGTTGSRQRAQPSQIARLNVLQPMPDILTIFHRQIDSILQRRVLCLLEEESLTGLRNSLLPKLISGQIRIKDAEKIMEPYI